MDIPAHTLRADAGIALPGRRRDIAPRQVAGVMAMAALPDVAHMLLLGWWSHIVIDVFTYSADYYPAPVLYPVTQRGFDGLAWNTPWFMLLNYAALAAVGLWLWRQGAGVHGGDGHWAHRWTGRRPND